MTSRTNKHKVSKSTRTPPDQKDAEHTDTEVLTVEMMIRELVPNEMNILVGVMCKWYLRFHNDDPFILEEFRFDIFTQFKALIIERQKLMEQIKKTGQLSQEISVHLNKEIVGGFDKVHQRQDKQEEKHSEPPTTS